MTTARIHKVTARDAACEIIRMAEADILALQSREEKAERMAAYARKERAEEIACLCERTTDDYITMNGKDCLWLLG